jgi:DNA-binding NarL/FixJ family response regulator
MTENGHLRVLLADREGFARDAIASLVRELDGVLLVGEIDERAGIEQAVLDSGAHVLVVDDRMVGETLADLGVRVLVLGLDDEPAYAARAERLGAEAWIVKQDAVEQLPELLARR